MRLGPDPIIITPLVTVTHYIMRIKYILLPIYSSGIKSLI